MRLYIPDMSELFAYMDNCSLPYVVLRGFKGLLNGFPKYGSKQDVDLLVDDRAIDPLIQRYSHISKRKGVKCDFYAPSSRPEVNYSRHTYYPTKLAQQILDNRIKWHEHFFIPCPEDHFYSLLYHIAYHKAECSGFDFFDSGPGRKTKYFKELEELREKTGLVTDYTLRDLHQLLIRNNYAIENQVLVSYVQREFERGRKSFFFGWLCNQWPGEMNLFVIRRTAVKHNKHMDILKILKKRYKILVIKRVSWVVRLLNARHMRGGKWRRGGKPYIAVVVFDPAPVEATPEERKIHYHVFNRNQFFKPEIREWFTNSTNARKNDNPLHSTDNEAEAIGHLSSFFDEQEQKMIFKKLTHERIKLIEAGHKH